ncbi:MAG: VOC family protein [Eubacterium sp.]|nr:VOC family protein [Eubacterium sp.]
MEKLITGIHHAALKCSSVEEFEKTVRFYSETLGMEIVRTWGEGAFAGIMLNTGDGSLMEIFANAESRLPQGAIRHLALRTGDVDAAVEAVRKAGYEITDEPKDIVIPSEVPFPARVAFAIGPVGEEIEFFCEK